MTTTEYLTAFHTQIDPLTSAAERCWAWSYAGHHIAGAEVGQTAPRDPFPAAFWADAGLMDAMYLLSAAGTAETHIPLPDLTRNQAHDLLPWVLAEVIDATGDVDHATDAQVLAFMDVQPIAVQAYTAHTGHLPGSGPQT